MLTRPQSVAQSRAWPARYELLDGLRGLAALGVVMAHLGVGDFGHLSVMVFFVISGYCITASARASQQRGDGFADFMRRRVRRIYPPYLLAIAFFVVTRLAKIAMGGENDLDRSAWEWLQNLTLTQWVSVPFAPIEWPSANPALFVAAFWSLNYEEQFYLIVGLAMLASSRAGKSLVTPIVVLGAVGLAWNFLWPAGWITGVFIEYFAHFALGSALYFVQCEYRSTKLTLAFAGLLGTLAAACAILIARAPETTLRAFEELAVLSVFTLLLLALRPASSAIGRHWAWQPVAALGTISYSLYLIHQFNLTLIGTLVDAAGLPEALRAATSILLMIGLATAFWYACERPFLNSRQRSAPAAA